MPSHKSKPALYYLSSNQLFRRPWKRRAHPLYLKSCAFFGATLIDRTGTLNSGIHFTVLDPLPPPLSAGESAPAFSQCCQQQAAHIARTAKGPIKMLWSGGIDSTVALIALYRHLLGQGQLHRLNVLLSQESIAEFPAFFHQFIAPKLAHEVLATTLYEHIGAHETIVTGEHGDQLFGSDKLKYSVMSGDAYRPYQEVLSFIISRKLGTERHTQAIMAYMAPQLKHSPIPIITLYDYLWWMNFSLKWQAVSMRLLHGLERPPQALEHTVFHFFRSAPFQQWSIANHHAKIKGAWHTYKYVAKEYIHAFFPNEAYLLHKEKVPSLKEVIVSPEAEGWGWQQRLFKLFKD